MSFLNQTSQDRMLSIQGCGYKIENDRVIVSIDQISSDRDETNISGTLLIELCALSQHTSKTELLTLASTTIGELKGQHFLSQCHYDLLFQHPPMGTWQLSLQLSEWDGLNYILSDKVSFGLLYQTQYMSDEADAYSAAQTEIEEPSIQEDLKEPVINDVPMATHNITTPSTEGKKLSSTNRAHLIVNKAKISKLKGVKKVPKKVLEKLIAERPFKSEQAILNIKGMGTKMLSRVLEHLS